jgi:hypothetical protein
MVCGGDEVKTANECPTPYVSFVWVICEGLQGSRRKLAFTDGTDSDWQLKTSARLGIWQEKHSSAFDRRPIGFRRQFQTPLV